MFILEEGHEQPSHDDKDGDDHNHDHDVAQGHSHDDGHEHKEEEKTYHFRRIEVKTGTSQLGFVQVTPLQKIEENAQIAVRGAYYIQSHLVKNQGGGGHAH